MYKILVAEDEQIERMVLCKFIRKEFEDTLELYEASNGIDAIQIFEKESIQIVILDVNMPGKDGMEVAEVIREKNPEAVIIFLTAMDEFYYAKKAIKVKAMDYLLKPYDKKELVYALEEAISLASKLPQQDTKEELFEEQAEENINGVRLAAVKRHLEEYIEQHYMEEITMQSLAEEMHYSVTYLCKLFKQCFYMNFTSYLTEFRIEKAKQLLENPTIPVKEVGIRTGFQDANYFTRVFKRVTGYKPTEYRIRDCIKG